MLLIVTFFTAACLANGDELEVVRYTNLWEDCPAKIADAAGITYLPEHGHLLISDSEISEYGDAKVPGTQQAVFQNRNVFELSLDAQEVFGQWMFVPPESDASEPVGVSWDEGNGHLFIVDDDQKRLYCYQADLKSPPDFGTPSISVSTSCGSDGYSDPEGVAVCPKSGNVLVVSGTQRERVIRFKFNAARKELRYLSEFSVQKHVSDPEGIAVHPSTGEIFLISSKSIARFSMAGKHLESYGYPNIRGWRSSFRLPGGAAFAPSSNPADSNDVLSLYVTCRGIDNGQFPNRNSLDGGLAELRLIVRSP